MIDIINMQNSFIAQSQHPGRAKSTYQQNMDSGIDIHGLKGTAVSQKDLQHVSGNFGGGRYGSMEETS